MDIKEYSYLIVGGVPKAGTSSLYAWLADHPQVSAFTVKETRFFLDDENDLVAGNVFNGGNLNEYELFFDDKIRLRVEATPNYLYSKVAPDISTLLPKSKMVMILRDPVERLVSVYKYSKQRGKIKQSESFEDYICRLLDGEGGTDVFSGKVAIEECKYEKFLPVFRESFGGRLLVIDFEELKNYPHHLMTKLCDFTGLSPEFYEDYSFQIKNASKKHRFPKVIEFYWVVKKRFVYALCKAPIMLKLFKRLNYATRKLMTKGNESKVEEVIVPDALRKRILKELMK